MKSSGKRKQKSVARQAMQIAALAPVVATARAASGSINQNKQEEQ